MELITKAEFARLCGVTAPFISQEIKKGNIPIVGRGWSSKIDLTHKKTVAFLNARTRRFEPKPRPPVAPVVVEKPKPRSVEVIEAKKPKRAKTKSKKKSRPQKATAPEKPEDLEVSCVQYLPDPGPEDLERQNNYSGGPRGDDEDLAHQFSDDAPYQIPPEYAQHVKTVESIRQIRIKTAKEEGSLISRDLVKRVLAEIYTVDVNQWKTLAANLAAKLAAAYGKNDDKSVRAAEKIVDVEVHSILEHTKRIIDGFVESTREGKK